MRIIVFFDLPTVTAEDKRAYRMFRKLLIKKGFVMMQESVYCRMALNKTVTDSLINFIRQNRPSAGLIQVLTVTEKQFGKMEYIVGEYKSDIIDSDERVVIL